MAIASHRPSTASAWHRRSARALASLAWYTDDAAATRTVQLTRLLCVYPKVARHQAGDPNSASSFGCVDPTP